MDVKHYGHYITNWEASVVQIEHFEQDNVANAVWDV